MEVQTIPHHRSTSSASKPASTASASATTPVYPFTPTTLLPSTPSPFLVFPSSSTLEDEARSPLPFEAMMSSPCAFDPTVFWSIMDNLLRNPNLTSSHLFRADIFWDSEKDASFTAQSTVSSSDSGTPLENSSFVKHMKEELRPRVINVKGWELKRCVVRKLVPRNTQLDRELVQTCCCFRKRRTMGSLKDFRENKMNQGNGNEQDPERGDDEDGLDSEESLVIYLPHVDIPEEIPWYHPTVKALAFLHTWRSASTSHNHQSPFEDQNQTSSTDGTLSLHILHFPAPIRTPKPPTDPRLPRTLLKILTTLHTHGHGKLTGYRKRVHHDQIVPQHLLQDRYTYLKNKYAKVLLNEYWKEVTDATKGVFEDLGIAAFLIELWREMYDVDQITNVVTNYAPTSDSTDQKEEPHNSNGISYSYTIPDHEPTTKPPFPGFVDLACGNGVLTYILLSEHYPGWGFDARSRKTWSAFPAEIRAHLHEMVLMPFAFPSSSAASPLPEMQTHAGIFPKGTFLISNHADELTPWTPLLAYFSRCPFLAIPCCSHDFSGARFRAPASAIKIEEARNRMASESEPSISDVEVGSKLESVSEVERGSEVGETERKKEKNKQKPKTTAPSAYASLCAYISNLTYSLGYMPEKEILRIPSTRNVGVLGRRVRREGRDGIVGVSCRVEESRDGQDVVGEEEEEEEEDEERRGVVVGLIKREMGREIGEVGREWRSRAAGIVRSKGRNH